MNRPAFYIFDMDGTLIDADCDVSWKRYAVSVGAAPADALDAADAFYRQYQSGTLDSDEFMKFQLREFAGRTRQEMERRAVEHFERFIRPRVYPAAKEMIASLLALGAPVAILTSTNDVLARPVADFFGIPEVLGTTLELAGDRYTGGIAGAYAAGAGKIAPAEEFVRSRGGTLEDLAYYGDSVNDLNLLERAGSPVAVNPDARLRREAEERGWPVVDFGRA